MKNKKIMTLTFIIAITIIFTGCKKVEPVAIQPTPTPTQTTNANTVSKGEQDIQQINQEAQKNNTLTDEQMIKIGEQTAKEEINIYLLKNDDEFNLYLNKLFIDPKIFATNLKEIVNYGAYDKVDVSFDKENVKKLGNNGLIYNAIITKKVHEKKNDKEYITTINTTYDIKKDEIDNQYKVLSVEGKEISKNY
jgi:hypothetical protein